MRRITILFLASFSLVLAVPAPAATGGILKVLPLFLDQKGRDALSPSLFDRDAYQAYLRQHPEKQSGMRFAVEWNKKGAAWEPLALKVEMRGIAAGNLPKEFSLEKGVVPRGWFNCWDNLTVSGPAYKELTEVTAWRVTLWEGKKLLSQEKSFLW